MNHHCYYAFEDLLLVYGMTLVDSYTITHRYIKSLSTRSLWLWFPLKFPFGANKCAQSSVSCLVTGHVHASRSPDPSCQYLQHLLLLVSLASALRTPASAAHLWNMLHHCESLLLLKYLINAEIISTYLQQLEESTMILAKVTPFIIPLVLSCNNV